MKDDDKEFFKAIRKREETIPIFLIPKTNFIVAKRKWCSIHKKYLNELKYSITLWTTPSLNCFIVYIKNRPWPPNNKKEPLKGLAKYFTGIRDNIKKKLLELDRYWKARNKRVAEIIDRYKNKSQEQILDIIVAEIPWKRTAMNKFYDAYPNTHQPWHGELQDILKVVSSLAYACRIRK